MNIKFDANNVVIKLCLSGMNLEDSGNTQDSIKMFQKALKSLLLYLTRNALIPFI